MHRNVSAKRVYGALWLVYYRTSSMVTPRSVYSVNEPKAPLQTLFPHFRNTLEMTHWLMPHNLTGSKSNHVMIGVQVVSFSTK